VNALKIVLPHLLDATTFAILIGILTNVVLHNATNARFNSVETRLSNMQARIDSRFDLLEAKFDTLIAKLDLG
jgi:hypothetical protein